MWSQTKKAVLWFDFDSILMFRQRRQMQRQLERLEANQIQQAWGWCASGVAGLGATAEQWPMTSVMCCRTTSKSRWWFQRFFIFTPNFGEMIQFDEPIFQTGWFNHQLVIMGLLRDTDGGRLWFSVNLFPPYPESWIQNVITVLYDMEPEQWPMTLWCVAEQQGSASIPSLCPFNFHEIWDRLRSQVSALFSSIGTSAVWGRDCGGWVELTASSPLKNGGW